MGEEIYKNLDFTNVVALLSKALETELVELIDSLSIGYISEDEFQDQVQDEIEKNQQEQQENQNSQQNNGAQ